MKKARESTVFDGIPPILAADLPMRSLEAESDKSANTLPMRECGHWARELFFEKTRFSLEPHSFFLFFVCFALLCFAFFSLPHVSYPLPPPPPPVEGSTPCLHVHGPYFQSSIPWSMNDQQDPINK